MLVVILLTYGVIHPVVAESQAQAQAHKNEGLWRPQGETAAALGHSVFAEAKRRDHGYVDMRVDLSMVLRTKGGKETERRLRIQQLEVANDGDKVKVVFDSPANIRGTALLSHARLGQDDDQWLFLPALKRVKKIASRNKTGRFVGSEFSFEDLAPPEVENFRYQYVGEETCGESLCYVVDRFPIDQYSGYARQRVWLHATHLTIQQIEFTDRQEKLRKRLTAGEYQRFHDQYWRAGYMRMDNLKNGRSTDLYWQNYQFASGLDDSRDFSVNALRRAR